MPLVTSPVIWRIIFFFKVVADLPFIHPSEVTILNDLCRLGTQYNTFQRFICNHGTSFSIKTRRMFIFKQQICWECNILASVIYRFCSWKFIFNVRTYFPISLIPMGYAILCCYSCNANTSRILKKIPLKEP